MHAQIHQLEKWKYIVDVYDENNERVYARCFKTMKEAVAYCKQYTNEIRYFRKGAFVRYIV